MKKRYLPACFLFLTVMLLLCGCTCDPAAHMWEVTYFARNTVFLSGVEQVDSYGGPSLIDPFGGMEEGVVSIVFTEDGTVTFAPGTGEALTGTFTTKDNGMQNTSFTVTLDNGEAFSGIAESYYYGRSLEFNFRGNDYRFEEAYKTAEVLYEEAIQDNIWRIRNNRGERLAAGEVTVVDGGYGLTMEDEQPPRRLDQTVAVQCVRLDAENNLTMLSAIELGPCYYATGKLSGGMEKIVIYYIEPLPERPTVPTEPEPTYLADLVSWLEDMEIYEDSYMKMTREFDSLPPGYVKYHRYITDKAEMEAILAQLKQIEMWEATREAFEVRPSDEVVTLRLYTGSYELVITSCGGYFRRGESEYWYFSEFPDFDYTGAVRSFIVSEGAVAELYEGDEYRGLYPDLDQYEFVVDTEEHDYTSAHYWTMVCEFGEIQIYDESHFRYKGQNYVIVGQWKFEFAQIPK